MSTKTVTAQTLHADYAATIADEAGLDLADYQPTAGDLAALLRDYASHMAGPVADLLDDAADDLAAIDRLGDDGPKTRELLRNLDSALYDIAHDLA